MSKTALFLFTLVALAVLIGTANACGTAGECQCECCKGSCSLNEVTCAGTIPGSVCGDCNAGASCADTFPNVCPSAGEGGITLRSCSSGTTSSPTRAPTTSNQCSGSFSFTTYTGTGCTGDSSTLTVTADGSCQNAGGFSAIVCGQADQFTYSLHNGDSCTGFATQTGFSSYDLCIDAMGGSFRVSGSTHLVPLFITLLLTALSAVACF